MGQDACCSMVYKRSFLSNEYLLAARKESDGALVPGMENLPGILLKEKRKL